MHLALIELIMNLFIIRYIKNITKIADMKRSIP